MHRSAVSKWLRLAAPLLGLGTSPAWSQGTFTFSLNESLSIPSVGKVTFVYAEDNRCPIEVDCLNGGNAYALLWLELGEKKRIVAVASAYLPSGLEASGKFFGSEFCFVRLEPKPSRVNPVQPRARTLTFSIQQNSSLKSGCPSGA